MASEHGEKKLGLRSVVSISVGLIIATSCLVSLGQGAKCLDAQHNGRTGTIYTCLHGSISNADFYGRRIFDL